MKTKFTYRYFRTIALLALPACIFCQVTLAAGKPFRSFVLEKEDPAKNKKEKTKTVNAGYNNNSVKIYPDILKRDMHVVAKKNDGKQVDFFVFDVEGTLVMNYKMKSRDHQRIAGLKKGIYVYHVFCGDEETATGKFEIR